jgi:hypothetical protein
VPQQASMLMIGEKLGIGRNCQALMQPFDRFASSKTQWTLPLKPRSGSVVSIFIM